ncbi:MAG: flavin-binding protein dodecin [Acidimicrobiales bacterium]|jgi:flavin-binding protein dodecin
MSAHRSEPTFKVIRLVATSAKSWEDAARLGVAEAAKTIPGLDEAHVMEMDTTIVDGNVARYRIKLEVAFQIDRLRPNPVAGGPDVAVRRYLIVGNETLAGDVIPGLVAERVSAGPSEFHVLVPATPSKETQRLRAVTGDPVSGYATVDLVGLREAHARDRERAQARLETFTDRLSDFRDMLSSEIGGADPFAAITQVMGRSSFDEIIVSTHAPGVSRWLKLDLTNRLERAFSVPVIVIQKDR